MVAANKVDQVIIAMPTAPGAEIREIVRICGEAGVQARTIPGMYELLGGTRQRQPTARGADRGPAAPRAGAHRRQRGERHAAGQARARHRRGRLHRHRAVPPDPPLRTGGTGAGGARRE